MKNYEITYLSSSILAEEDQKQLKEKVSSLIQDKGGVLKEGEVPVKRILPQNIGQHKEVLSVSLYFYANPEKIQEIQDALRSEASIIRSMIINKEAASSLRPARKRIRKEAEKKVELEDIEKKIDEILG